MSTDITYATALVDHRQPTMSDGDERIWLQ